MRGAQKVSSCPKGGSKKFTHTKRGGIKSLPLFPHQTPTFLEFRYKTITIGQKSVHLDKGVKKVFRSVKGGSKSVGIQNK